MLKALRNVWLLIHSSNKELLPETLQKEIFLDKETASKLNRDLWGMGQAQLRLPWQGDGLSQDPFHEVTCSKSNHGTTAEEVPQLPTSAREAKLEYATFKL